jgi:hypothetical protein
MLVGRPTMFGLIRGILLQIYVIIFNVDSPAYEHPMLDVATYLSRIFFSGNFTCPDAGDFALST